MTEKKTTSESSSTAKSTSTTEPAVATKPKVAKKFTAKKTPTNKSTSKKAPVKRTKFAGVIASIVEELTKATKSKPMTKDALLAQLVERFPDRGDDAMKRTIACQVPSRLLSDKGIKVEKNDEQPAGYWIA